MRFIATEIPSVIVVEPRVWEDHRGFFMETWNRRSFAEAGIDVDFVQDNHSRSVQGTLRGLHYQIRRPQGKLVRVTAGEIFDVVVDLRRNSKTFGCWVGRRISAQNRLMLWAPPGFAHGFYVISESADFLYKCTDYYAPEFERVLAWDDRDIGIEWPIVGGTAPQLLERDARGVRLTEAEVFE
jgi:dTDP-4-dehydrorhamnose 3,5-epimerase